MARIRNIKPAFFRHEALQDLEAAHPGQHVMLVYIGLWTQCDSAGIFPWLPRQLKLDILPFLDFNIAVTLDLLEGNGFVRSYVADGKKWGHIPTFTEHQRIVGKELTDGERYPKPGENATGKQQGNNREAGGNQKGEQERSIGKDIRKGELESNAHAHEGQSQIEKKGTATTPPDRAEPLGDFARAYAAIQNWGETDEGHAEIVAWKKITGYRDSQHGPTTDELAKFTSYHLGPKTSAENRQQFLADPLAFFRAQFPGWLTNAKAWNRQPRTRGKPPENAREYTPPYQPRRNGPSGSPVHISSLIPPPSQ